MKIDIRDLNANMGNFTLKAKVVEKSQEFLKGRIKYASAIIADDTGCIQLNLYGKQVNQAKEGRTIVISGCFTEVNKGSLEIRSWKDIKICAKRDRESSY